MEGAEAPSTRPHSVVWDGHSNGRQIPDVVSTAGRRDSKGLKPSTASPEVITSLISSLSAISTPAEDLFDSLLPIANAHSAPPTPTGQSFRISPPRSQQGSALGNGFLHPDDAATAPVIRTSKPPSGYSPLTTNKKHSIHGGPSKWTAQEKGLVSSIGNLSIEPGPRRSSASISIASEGSGRSRSFTSLRMKASKDRMKEIDRERKKKNNIKDRSRSPSKLSLEESVVAPESPRIGEFPNGFGDAIPLARPIVPTRTHSMPQSQANPAPVIEDSQSSIGAVRNIPQRESSLRHSSPEASRTRRKRKSYKTSLVPADTHIEEASEESGVEKLLPPLPSTEKENEQIEEDSVTKRIKELKAQKEERDRSQSDDESSRQKEKNTRSKTEAVAARKSLPARSSRPTTTRSMSEGQFLTDDVFSSNGSGNKPLPNRPGDSHVAQSSNSRVTSPLSDSHNRNVSSPLSAGRKSSQIDDRLSIADSIDDAVNDYITASRLSYKIYHPQTGRAISFSEVGDPEGSVVFCCVGMGTTRFLTAFYDELAFTLRLRLITPDRPGIGDSEPHTDGLDAPLAWPDDIRLICQHLGISRFSILAHSAGAIYALATALRMPQHIRGRIHLLAPWIPPSQMVAIGLNQDPIPITTLPASQRFLRALPTPLLKAANSSFFAMTSASITTSVQRAPRRSKRRSLTNEVFDPTTPTKTPRHIKRNSLPLEPEMPMKSTSQLDLAVIDEKMRISEKERQSEYDARLTQAIWEAATAHANPAVDLLVCLERRQDIGFRYADISKAVVIHHGSRDTRVPVENIKWLGNLMRNCDIRVLEGEGHGLMASATVMSNVLTEISKEWDDWNAVTRNKRR